MALTLNNAPAIKTISDFRSQIRQGVRPNLFECVLAWPDIISAEIPDFDNMLRQTTFLCKAAALPASTINPVNVPFRGRDFKISGERQIGDWTVTIYNDQAFAIRSAFELWQNRINNVYDTTGYNDPAQYQTDMGVYQLQRSATSTAQGATNYNILRAYSFYDVWPSDVSEIALDYQSNDEIETFSVTFKVQWFEALAFTPQSSTIE